MGKVYKVDAATHLISLSSVTNSNKNIDDIDLSFNETWT